LVALAVALEASLVAATVEEIGASLSEAIVMSKLKELDKLRRREGKTVEWLKSTEAEESEEATLRVKESPRRLRRPAERRRSDMRICCLNDR